MQDNLTFNGLVWKPKNAWLGQSSLLWLENQVIGEMMYSTWGTEVTVRLPSGEWIFTYSTIGEFSVFDKVSGEEIAMLETVKAFSTIQLRLRLRYDPEKVIYLETIKEKWWAYAWQWADENHTPLMRYATKFSFSEGYVSKILTLPTWEDKNMELYMALGLYAIYYYRNAGAAAT
ncbi:MAG: hypothetical protein ACKVTZ_21730 [Bacteroidia bacterium]